MTAVFITGTGTDIGKTFVATGLIRYFRDAGQPVMALKPVVTGFYPAEAAGSDPGLLLAAMGKPPSLHEIERVAPWRYAAPLAPSLAARRENRALDFEALIDFTRRATQIHGGTLLVEGVGGIMVPLDHKHTVLDWMAALKLPLLLVTGSYLGSISHTLTAIDVAHRRDLAIKALIVNETPNSTVTIEETTASLTQFAPAIPLVALARLPSLASGHATFGEIAKFL